MERPRMGAHESSLAWRMESHRDIMTRTSDLQTPGCLKHHVPPLAQGPGGAPLLKPATPMLGLLSQQRGLRPRRGLPCRTGCALRAPPAPRPGCQPLHQHLTPL